MTYPSRRTPETAVTTFLTPHEQQRVDAAGTGCYVALHRNSIEDVLHDLRSRTVNAALVSVSRYQAEHAPQVVRMVREFPQVPALALLTDNAAHTTQAVLALGQHGIRTLVDARDPKGWRDLRHLVTRQHPEQIETVAVQTIQRDLEGAPADCLRFFEALFLSPPFVSTVQQIARANGIVPSTFMSRFFRVQLPAPKRYLAVARLVRAAGLFENPGLSIAHVANHLEYSSAQSFTRHVHLVLGCTPMHFRRQHTGRSMLHAMRNELVLPYRETLLRFEPFATMPSWSVLRAPLPVALVRPSGTAAGRAGAMPSR